MKNETKQGEENVALKNVPPVAEPETQEPEDGPLFDMSPEELLVGGARGGGQKIRPNVGYTILGKPTNTDMPLQQRTLIVLIMQNLTKRKTVISEPELAVVLENAKASGLLKTRQDSWRIFQYYRKSLMEKKILAERPVHVVPAAVAAAK